MPFQGPPTKASNSVLNLTDPPIFKMVIEPSIVPPADPHALGINMNGSPLYNLRDPIDVQDAATKAYIDARTGGTEVGMMLPWVADLVQNPVPDGWLLCDGRTIGDVGTGASVESNTLEELFEILKYVSPNAGTEVWGVNTVQLPDMRGRVAIGADAAIPLVNLDSNSDIVGNTAGVYEHVLTVGQMPGHNHGGGSFASATHTHNHSHTHSVGPHTHPFSGTTSFVSSPSQAEGGNGDREWINHSHTFSGTTGAGSGSTGGASPADTGTPSASSSISSQGLDQAHPNMQPYLVVHWIIRFGALPGSPGFGGVEELGDLLDVTLASVTASDILLYNGAQWVNVPSTSISSAFLPGDVKATIRPTADPGWIMMDDGTIGNAASGATTLANADTFTLFSLLWALDPTNTFIVVSGGRGPDAATDFGLSKTITLPKALGRALVGADPGLSLLSPARNPVVGNTTGTETHTLTVTEMPSHRHDIGSDNLVNVGSGQNQATGANNWGVVSPPRTDFEGGGQPHENMQPSMFVNYMMKL